MNTQSLIQIAVDSLRADMKEYADDFDYWMNYDVALDEIDFASNTQDVVEYINKILRDKLSSSPEHHAATDVASHIEVLDSKFKGEFKYQ
jgi:hypothetical protein